MKQNFGTPVMSNPSSQRIGGTITAPVHLRYTRNNGGMGKGISFTDNLGNTMATRPENYIYDENGYAYLSPEVQTPQSVEAPALLPQAQQTGQSSYTQTVSPGLVNSPQQQQAATGYTPTSQRGRATNFGR